MAERDGVQTWLVTPRHIAPDDAGRAVRVMADAQEIEVTSDDAPIAEAVEAVVAGRMTARDTMASFVARETKAELS